LAVTDHEDDPWLAHIEKCLEAVEQWSARTAAAESPRKGSHLAADDERNPSFPASVVAWSSIGSAVDHLGLAEDSIRREGGGRLRPMWFYTVCRGALVAASQAIWVMTGSRDVRLRRVRLLELEETKSFQEFLNDYARDEHLAEDTSTEFAEKVLAKAQAQADRYKALQEDLKPQRGEYSVTRTLRDAAQEIQSELEEDRWLRRAYMFEWRAASGDAHARQWTRSVRPRIDVPLIGEGARLRITTGTTETYGQSLGAATMATSHALRLWDEQTVASSDSPA
jgi:hypothetical protein